jgi:Flp pilus assembly protein TadG
MPFASVIARFASTIERYSDCRKGGVLVVFALVLSVIVGVIGMAIDFGRVTSSKSKLQQATDAALLAAIRTLGATGDSDKAIQTANAYFMQKLSTLPDFSAVSLDALEIDATTQTISARGSATIDSTFLQIIGFPSIAISSPSRAQAAVGEMEISIMIDLSSSMTGRRFAELRTTLTEFVQQMMRTNEGTGPVRLAFAPFASAVNPGPFFNAVSGASGAANRCVRERSGAQQYTDAAPGPGAYFDVFVQEPGWPCLTFTIMPLESNKTTVLDKVSSLTLSEGTSGHMGTMWSWYLISPNWSSIWPAASAPKPYGAVPKVAILMTDGENFTNFLSSNAAADAYALQICQNMKAAGVTIFSVGFEVEVSRAVDLLKGCATSSDKHFFPNGGAEFSDAFRQISQQLTQLRLTN